ncbi:hypothetical protein [Streptomyces sp. NPDC001297]|uniref:hypothetical protein n=1 Tax=Streptomyces sp. NPDC001297 TaxID=3364559 RepID=UPI00369F8807
MNAKDLEGLFEPSDLIRVTLADSPEIEVSCQYATFTDSGITLKGLWMVWTPHPATEEEFHYVIGARFIPWAQIKDIDASTDAIALGSSQVEEELRHYGASEDPSALEVKASVEMAERLRQAKWKKERGQQRGQQVPAPPRAPGKWPTPPGPTSGA